MSFMDQLMNGLKSNPIRRQREADADATEQQVDERKHNFDMKLFDHMNEIGALPMVGGSVKAPMYDTSAPADMPDVVTVRPADKSRVFTHKDASGETVQWELPDQATQERRGLYKHMQETMGPVQSQVRGAENQNKGDAAAAQYGGITRGKLEAENADTQANGFEIPSELDKTLPGISKGANGQPRKVKSSEFDDITRAAGQYGNYMNEAKNRDKVKPVGPGREVTDDQGNTTIATEMTDGTVKETKLNAKGKTAKATGGTTEYQQFQMGRETANDAHNRAMVWQNKLDKYEEEGSTLAKENVAHGQEMVEIGTQLENGELSGSAKKQAIRRKGLLQSLIDGNNEKFKTIESQKKAAMKIKDSIMGANGIEPKAAAAPKRATLGQVNAYAKENHLSLDAAQKAFEADGVTIVK